MSQPDVKAFRLQFTGAVLGVAHLLIALGLLALSGWFIAASALVGVWGLAAQFNYVVPSTVIRLLAFLRVLSGYGERYVGHLGLLRRLGEIRSALFGTLVRRPGYYPSADALERIEADAEALAGAWVSIWNPLSGLVVTVLVFGLAIVWWVPQAALPWFGFSVGVVLMLALGYRLNRRRARWVLGAQVESRASWLEWERASPLWSLMKDQGGYARPYEVWSRWQQQFLAEESQIQRLDHGLQLLGWMAIFALGVWLYPHLDGVQNQALLLVPILIWLAARDWLSGVARALPELSRYPLRNGRVDALLNRESLMDFGPDHSLPPIAGTRPVELLFEHYQWRRGDRLGEPLSTKLSGPGLILLEAGSGVGKSSLFQAMLGMIPETGRWTLNGVEVNAWSAPERRSWFHLCEQFGHVFSDTLAANLRLARPEATDADCLAALRWAGLEEWARQDRLELWIGEPGRPLSGGEQKRLLLARAWLRDAPVWLIDEPFEGLDKPLMDSLACRLQALSRQRLIIMASHLKPAGLTPDQRLLWLG